MNKQLRIAIFSDTADPQRNGVAQSIERQTNALQRKGHQVFTVCSKEFNTSIPIDDRRLFSTKDPLYALRVPKKLTSAYQEVPDFDVAHVHTPFIFGVLGFFEARRRGRPCVYTHHTNFEHYLSYVPGFSNALGKRIFLSLYQRLIRRFAVVLFPSKHSMLQSRPLLEGSMAQTAILPTPLSDDFDSFQFVERPRIYDICCVGRLSQEKNIFLMALTIKNVLSARPNTQVLIVGGGKDTQAFRRMFDTKELRCLSFTGEISHSLVLQKLAQSRILFQTSLSETQGLVLQEAWSMGTPAVLTASPNTREFLTEGKNGWSAPNRSEDLSKLIVKVLDKRLDRQNTVFQYCQRSARNFSQKRWADKYITTINRVLG